MGFPGFKKIFIYLLAVLGLSCSLWDLVALFRILHYGAQTL